METFVQYLIIGFSFGIGFAIANLLVNGVVALLSRGK